MTHNQFEITIRDILESTKVVPSKKLYAVHYSDDMLPLHLLRADEKDIEGDFTSAGIRQYESSYMNDPSEGKEIVKVLERLSLGAINQDANTPDKTRKRQDWLFQEIQELKESWLLPSYSKKFTFISSWTMVPQPNGTTIENLDDLNMWRLYGRDGAGSCLIIPSRHIVEYFGGNLFSVKYGTNLQGGGTGAGGRLVNKLREALTLRIQSLPKSKDGFKVSLRAALDELRVLMFLIKSNDYLSENESRSAVSFDLLGEELLSDIAEDVNGRVYFKGNDGLIPPVGSTVIFGPNANHEVALRTMYWAKRRGVKMNVFMSSKKYRKS